MERCQHSNRASKLQPLLASSLLSLSILLVLAVSPGNAQSGASLTGHVTDQAGSVVVGANVRSIHTPTNVECVTRTNLEGDYQCLALPVGDYRIEVRAAGFQSQIVENLTLEVGRSVILDFKLRVGEITEVVIVDPAIPVVEHTTTSVGQLINSRTIQNIPLNGRHFIDLGLLVPGSLTPPQNAPLSAPVRGHGSFGIHTAGNREDGVNFQVNGITLNDLTLNVTTFLPPLSSIQEFRIDNSTISAEYGRNSGAIVNIATRSGTNDFHGELFEYFRNDAFDARNFFDFTSRKAHPFKRSQFGGSVGGPVFLPRFGETDDAFSYRGRDRTFFYFSYEGLRQRQAVSLNTVALSDFQRAAVTDPIIRRLLDLLPRANFVDSSGISRFVGSEAVQVTADQWSLDISQHFNEKDRLHVYYGEQRDKRNEPNLRGDTVPGFGEIRQNLKQLLTLNETHVFNSNVVNVARFGFSRVNVAQSAVNALNPADFQILNGLDEPSALPQINVAGAFSLGGPRGISGRDDYTIVLSDTLIWSRGTHSLKFGSEYRHFVNDRYMTDVGTFNFANVPAFMQGNANAFSISLGNPPLYISQDAVDIFVTDNFKYRSNLTLDLGIRYSLNLAPTERSDRLVLFDPERVALVQVGVHVDKVYETNANNFQPRVGLAWDPFKDGKTSLRAGYAISTAEPMVNAVNGLGNNPPLATPLAVTGMTGAVRLDNALTVAGPAGLAPLSVDHDYANSYVQSWNLNLQRELIRDFVVMVGYFGSKGTHLRLVRNINQPVNGGRPFPRLSPASPILPGAALGNIVQIEGSGNSSYNALWLSAKGRALPGLHLTASYTLSKSIDYNSFGFPAAGITVQDSYNLRGDRGLSDFDARNRFAMSAIYDVPFKLNRFVRGWQLAAIFQTQTGSPFNVVSGNSAVNGVANTLRPDVNGSVQISGSVERWFDTAAFTSFPRFGNFGRNVLIGPGFNNLDFSLLRKIKLTENIHVQFRAEAFNLFNVANFGLPGRTVGTASFGRISNTRFPTGDSGSSRQLQFATKLMF